MNLFKRIFISVTRRKTASLVILLVAFLMGNVMAISIAIQQSSESIRNDLLERVGGEITISNPAINKVNILLDNYQYKQEMTTIKSLCENISSHEHVKYADINYRFEEIKLANEENYELDNSVRYYNGISHLYGIENRELVDEKKGYIRLSSGNYFTEDEMLNGENVLIVNENIKRNGVPLQVGDVVDFEIKVTSFDRETMSEIILFEKTISYEIVGTFKIIENKYSDVENVHNIQMFYVPNQNIQNNFDEYASINQKRYSKIWVESMTVLVDSTENLDEVVKYVKAKTDDTWKVISTIDTVSKLIAPVNSLKDIAQLVMVFAMGAMTLIVGLISFYFIRDRKYEIGIYLSLGIRKYQLIIQIIMESLLVGLLGIMLSIGSGYLISQKYSDYLLNIAIQTENEEKDKYIEDSESLILENLNEEDILNDYEITITLDDIIILFGLSSVTIILSSIFPLSYIVNLKPKNIQLG